ncbi:MAG: methylated-DNA--[protein]-cysteine S-methyltransferase [Methanosarcinales archaeon]|jgi:methylated-DNA-[protein]-cysteine S-methyltransferase|nr:methylated-DNA--[protein]-cysteine S-methyltransferase [Methanosarcinales archaeon]
MYYQTNYASPFGRLLLASDGENIIGLWIEGQKYHGSALFDMKENNDLPVFADAKNWLDRYFAGEKPAASELPLAPIGGEFRQTVWKILCSVPYGKCVTYGGIAKKTAARMNKPNMSCRAVGGAVGHNPISIIIPCHRVVGSNGSLTGYAGGIDKKIKLLEHEGVDLSAFSVPKKGSAL